MSERKPRGYWTLERCMEDAAQYSRKSEWRQAGQGGYLVAYRNGWLDQCCEHMKEGRKPNGYWSLDQCKEDASNYRGRREWELASESAYATARSNGWLDQCCEHMERLGSDNDVVYIWRDEVTGLHKVGITSDRLGEYRIGGDNKGMDPRIVFMLKVADARAVESQLLELGTDPELDSSVDGYTEFRRLTDAQLGQAVSIAYEAALAA